MGYLQYLECTRCGERYSPNELHNLCSVCGKVLFARYDLDRVRADVPRAALGAREATMWRYREVMPVENPANIVTLGEGMTPLLPLREIGRRLGLRHVFVKEEGLNPTGSFKARGLSAAVSKAKELGVRTASMPSAGNAGSAAAAYCARAGMEVYLVMPADVPHVNQVECDVYGAHTYLIRGLINDAGRSLREQSKAEGWFDMSTLKEPYRVEGKKTMGYELAEQFNWSLPDVVIYPTGGGTGIVGMWKAFSEMEALGWIGKHRPRMVIVQAAGCAPMVRAHQNGSEHAEPWQHAHTIAAGLRVPEAIGDYLILQAVRESGGTSYALTDEQILADMRELAATEGLFACPEGAATYGALRAMVREGRVAPDERVVLFNTGAGLKYVDLIKPELPTFEPAHPPAVLGGRR
ncbi:MAG TPA: threonine synthase [bacterium]|nr:threonine synthase [bacterium]